MRPTDTSNPNYFHKVVDCQYACPAHTDVPGYIRHIAQGEFTEAYMLNRKSNVFPGILGRVCDRPCEPACRRGRVEDKPVAICRLKRVAADNRDEVKHLIPKADCARSERQESCAWSVRAAHRWRWLMIWLPLGYRMHDFRKAGCHGRSDALEHPVLPFAGRMFSMKKFENILDMGQLSTCRLGDGIDSMKAPAGMRVLTPVFVGTGAPRGKELNLPGPRRGGRQYPYWY